MIFLTLLYLFFFSRPWNTFALPTTVTLQSDFIHDESHFGTRSIYGILWSCLSTIFTCTWIVVHPNIPAPGDSKWAVLGRRVAIMAYVLIAPEFVIVWAGRQHFAARNIAKKHEKNHPGWTRAHAFFLIMGGFTLHEGGKPVRILEAKELEELSEAGRIEWPTITEDEIADRSKGDYLSKTIVLFQTTWFIAQCIARGVYGLDVTELEVVTLAFATLTSAIYYFWWDKPLDVRCSIPVKLLKGRLEEMQDNVVKEDASSRIISPDQGKEGDEKGAILPNPLPSLPAQGSTSNSDLGSTSIQGKEEDEKGTILPNPLTLAAQGSTSTPDSGSISVQGKEEDEKAIIILSPQAQGSTSILDPGSISDPGKEGDENGPVLPNPLPSSQDQGTTVTSIPDPALTRMRQFQTFRRRARIKYGSVSGSIYVFIIYPLENFFRAFIDMTGAETLEDKTLRVPTFYSSPDVDRNMAIGLGFFVSIVFGAIHCIAWSFHFTTMRERWAWRISAILVSGSPIAILVLSSPLVFDVGEFYVFILGFIILLVGCLYIVARITLLILPFVALRAPVPGAYVELDWVSFLPHI